MKKLIYLFAFAALMVSCTGNEDSENNNVNPDTALVKKITYQDEGDNFSTTFSYNGTKLTETVDSDGYHTTFTYSGDLITKLEEFDSDDSLTNRSTYEYNNQGQLIKYTDLSFEDDYASVYTYVHNADGTISYSMDSGSVSSQTFSHDGVITATQYTEHNEQFNQTETYTFTFDNKNNPFKNITGYDKVYFADNSTPLNYVNNPLTVDSTQNPDDDATISYTYNAANFPISSTTSEFGETYTTTYTYK